jgi:hypothetical protein
MTSTSSVDFRLIDIHEVIRYEHWANLVLEMTYGEDREGGGIHQ